MPPAPAPDRLRPILMTAWAMTVGMVPMVLTLERAAAEMAAPFGPGGDRRAGRVHVRDAVHRPVRLRPADGQEDAAFGVAASG